MAAFGANCPCFKPENESVGVVIGKLVSANLTVNLASGELYADDGLAENVSEFSSGTLAMETDDMADAVAGKVYGCTVSGGAVTYNKDDSAPFGELAYYKALMRGGVKLYKGYYYPKAKAALGNDNAQTKGSSITFQTTSTSFTIFADENGDWRETKEFSTKDAAEAWVKNKTSVEAGYGVTVQVQNAGDGEGVTPTEAYAAAGDNVVLTISGTPLKLYDNGTDKTASISSNQYTISSIAADHSVAVIF